MDRFEVNALLDEAWRSGYCVGHKEGLFNLSSQPGQSPYTLSKWIEDNNER